MNEGRTDFELVRDFARNGDQLAFTSAVRRHLNLVYGTALRKVGDPGGAEEVTQNVFAALARKAWQFAPDDSLAAWLHRTTLLEAKMWLRGELRRRRREESAAQLGTIMTAPEQESAFRALTPVLDEALLSLREKDRTAVLLRYYEGQSLRDVGVSLGVNEDTAQKRVASAVERLASFFQRRGFKTASTSMAVAVLQNTAFSAPAAVVTSVVQAAAHLAPSTMLGLGTVLGRLCALTKTQTATLCILVAAAPVGWQLHEFSNAKRENSAMLAKLETARTEADELSSEMDRWRIESARTSTALAEARQAQAANEEARGKWDSVVGRLRALLNDPNYHWPDDLAYVRIPKSVIKQLELSPMFHRSGALSETALDLLEITPEEKSATEGVLTRYWKSVHGLMTARAYETNTPNSTSGYAVPPTAIAKTVIVPALGDELRTLAQDTKLHIAAGIDAERAEILFGSSQDGSIQMFWPGNRSKIAEEPQTFTVWVDPNAATTNSAYGARWHTPASGVSSMGPGCLMTFPQEIIDQFFAGWLEQLGVRYESGRPKLGYSVNHSGQ